MFSQHERRQLNEIERWIEEWDPELARKLTDEPEPDPPHPIGLIIFLYALGVFFVVVGMITGNIVVTIAGAAATTGGIVASRQNHRRRG